MKSRRDVVLRALRRDCGQGNVNNVKYILDTCDLLNLTQEELTELLLEACKHNEFPFHLLIANFLLQHGANINARNSTGQFPLQQACVAGNAPLVKFLLDEGGFTTFRGYDLQKLFNFSIETNKLELTRALLSFALDASEHCDASDALVVCERFHEEMVSSLGPTRYNSAEADMDYLCWKMGGKDVVSLLVPEFGIDVNAFNDFGGGTGRCTALFHVCAMGRLDAAFLLLECGADPSLPDKRFSLTPLHEVARWGSVDLVEALVSRGADVFAKKNLDSVSPYDVAVVHDKADVQAFLLKAMKQAKSDCPKSPMSSVERLAAIRKTSQEANSVSLMVGRDNDTTNDGQLVHNTIPVKHNINANAEVGTDLVDKTLVIEATFETVGNLSKKRVSAGGVVATPSNAGVSEEADVSKRKSKKKKKKSKAKDAEMKDFVDSSDEEMPDLLPRLELARRPSCGDVESSFEPVASYSAIDEPELANAVLALIDKPLVAKTETIDPASQNSANGIVDRAFHVRRAETVAAPDLIPLSTALTQLNEDHSFRTPSGEISRLATDEVMKLAPELAQAASLTVKKAKKNKRKRRNGACHSKADSSDLTVLLCETIFETLSIDTGAVFDPTSGVVVGANANSCGVVFPDNVRILASSSYDDFSIVPPTEINFNEQEMSEVQMDGEIPELELCDSKATFVDSGRRAASEEYGLDKEACVSKRNEENCVAENEEDDDEGDAPPPLLLKRELSEWSEMSAKEGIESETSPTAAGRASKANIDSRGDKKLHPAMFIPTPILDAAKSKAEARNLKKSENLFPESFLCPMGLELMRDPVICADGHSYERQNIEQWFHRLHVQSGNDHPVTSPLTNEPLASTLLIPNHALRAAIQDFCRYRDVTL